MSIKTKTCSRCFQQRSLGDFYASYKSCCKECVRIAAKLNHATHRDSRLEKQRAYYQKIDKDKERRRQAIKREKLRDQIKTQQRTHYEANKQAIHERNKILSKTEKYRTRRRENDKRKTDELTDSVVKRLLVAGSDIKWKSINEDLVLLKRDQVLAKRLHKQLNNLIKEKSNGS